MKQLVLALTLLFTITIHAEQIAGDIQSNEMTSSTAVIDSSAPKITLHNTTDEDTDEGRESQIDFRGDQSGGEESSLALIETSHDGASDDSKGKIVIQTNNGTALTDAMIIDSSGNIDLPSGTWADGHIIIGSSTQAGNLKMRRGTSGTATFEMGWSSATDDTDFIINNGSGGATIDLQTAGISALLIDGSQDITMAGDLDITGALSKGSGTFTIDHPLDPENKLLQHSFVESPEMRNVYYGQAMLKNGKAIVTLPNWWHPLNGTDKTEFNYQLTCIGGYTQLWISSEVENGEFEISGNADIKVSWTLSAIRHDAYAEANRVQVEVLKDESDIGTYRHAITDEQKAVNKAKKDKLKNKSK